MKYSIRFLLLVTALAMIGAILISRDMHSKARSKNEDAQLIVAVLVCDYLDDHQNQWPPNWDALKLLFDEKYSNGGQYSFDDLQTEVSVDFDIDGSKLLETCVNDQLKMEFKPIRSQREHFDDQTQNPNSLILNYIGRMVTQ